MTITVAKSAGFCAGVARAVDTAYQELSDNPKKNLATLGQLIHNSTVTNDLAVRGVRIVNSLDEIQDETVIIRSHGITKEAEEELRRRNIPYIDRTCPCVKAVHRHAAEAVKKGRKLIVIGEPTHPEIIGIVGYGGEGVIVAKEKESLHAQLSKKGKYTIVAQTTFETDIFKQIVSSLADYDIEIHNTICNATSTRQNETKELAKNSDIMIVIGDKCSANTRALYEISTRICLKTIFIESIHDLQLLNLKSGDRIGVTAGASTPPALTKEAVQFMSELVNAVPAETNENADEMVTQKTSAESFEDMLNESFKPLHSGNIVKGTVIQVTPTEVTVNLGYKSDGIITRQEFSDDQTTELTELAKPGDVFDVFVIRVNDGDGNVLASKKKLVNQANYKLLEQAHEEKTVVTGKVTEVIKGGLLANVFGMRAFIPSSQVSNRFVEDLTQFKGQEINLHILELDRNKRRIVAGRKELATIEAKKAKEEVFSKLEVGQRIEGKVSRLTDFGAFVDLGGIDGLIHVSEMGWRRVKKASDVVQAGDVVTVNVIGIDSEKGKISLSLKDVSNNPWTGVEDRYPIGSIVDGQVVRLTTFGAFISLEEGVDGLVHISQIANRHITKPDEVLTIGQYIQVKVTGVDIERNRINLSKREADVELGYELYEEEEEYYDDDEEYIEEDVAAEFEGEGEEVEAEFVYEADETEAEAVAEEAAEPEAAEESSEEA